MYGLSDELWKRYQQLCQMSLDYQELAYMHDGKPLDFDKCLEDALEKWSFMVRWTAFLNTKYTSVLRKKPSFHIVRKFALEDEPLCYEALFLQSPIVTDACQLCLLYKVNGKKCNHKGSLKERVVRPLVDGVGIFRPFEMVRLLNQIRRGSRITYLGALDESDRII